MAACFNKIGGKGAPRMTLAYSCGHKWSVELFSIYLFSKRYMFKLHAIKDKAYLHKKRQINGIADFCLELIEQNFSSIHIYFTIFTAHALKAIRWRSLLLLFRYLRFTKICTIILYSPPEERSFHTKPKISKSDQQIKGYQRLKKQTNKLFHLIILVYTKYIYQYCKY